MDACEYTCGNCQHLELTNLINTVLAGCDQTGLVVPHRSESAEDRKSATLTFTRIPESCPRSDVVKSEKTAPTKHHITKKINLEDL